jgi:hypothetical protein
MLTVVAPRPARRSGKSVRPCATITVPKAQKKQKAVSSTTATPSAGCGSRARAASSSTEIATPPSTTFLRERNSRSIGP